MKTPISIFWFRRDIRLHDNTALNAALSENKNVLPIFIFDTTILEELPQDDARVSFLHNSLNSIHNELKKYGASLNCLLGKPIEVWKQLADTYDIQNVYFNKDYEPYARERDSAVSSFLSDRGIKVLTFKDQVIFEEGEIVKNDGKPYTVYTPYKNKWLTKFSDQYHPVKLQIDRFWKTTFDFPSLEDINFQESKISVPTFDLSVVKTYTETRNFPWQKGTSSISTHLRFGTVSIREIVSKQTPGSTYLNELIWREFFMQILYHFPKSAHSNFKTKYDFVEWRNNKLEFDKWCTGQTGYPIVDAGMRELNETGLMHNRVRMITAGFLCKHLLIDWRWGEAYFAKKLLDFDLSSNVGNWQWAAGTGCDSAPYFRIFNPAEQQKKFDAKYYYVNKWVPDLNSFDYPAPIVDHKVARERALTAYKKGLSQIKM
jgi:deoxyribodipyrimidine photo-lyase